MNLDNLGSRFQGDEPEDLMQKKTCSMICMIAGRHLLRGKHTVTSLSDKDNFELTSNRSALVLSAFGLSCKCKRHIPSIIYLICFFISLQCSLSAGEVRVTTPLTRKDSGGRVRVNTVENPNSPV